MRLPSWRLLTFGTGTALALLVSYTDVGLAGAPVPEARRTLAVEALTGKPPDLDGKLDDPAWKQAVDAIQLEEGEEATEYEPREG